jgi:hypothetical protein
VPFPQPGELRDIRFRMARALAIIVLGAGYLFGVMFLIVKVIPTLAGSTAADADPLERPVTQRTAANQEAFCYHSDTPRLHPVTGRSAAGRRGTRARP